MKKHVTALVAVLGSLSAVNAQAEQRDLTVGFYAMGGFTAQENLKQLPVQTSSMLSDSSDTGGMSGGVAATLSYDMLNDTGVPLILELGTAWHARHDFNVSYAAGGSLHGTKLNVMSWDIMVSALYKYENNSSFTPYFGGGAGVVHHYNENSHMLASTNVKVGNSHDTNFAWQVQGGVTYDIAQNWDLRADYRYIDMGEVHSLTMPGSGSHFTADVVSHDIRLGAQWHF